MLNKIRVNLDNRSYEILIGSGIIDHLTKFLAHKNYSKIFIITDEKIAKLHLTTLKQVLNESQINSETIITESGEQAKSFASLEKICEEILQKNIDRKSLIIAFGGGVIGDLSGFIASILLRGIDFIQIPTTLLAAVDSSVGGKTAINSKSGKNLIGSFYQPQLVITDLNFLKTLPKRQLLSGYAEVLKYALIQDQNFFDFLTKNYQKIFSYDQEILAEIIKKSCQSKSDIVSQDERENGIRALLNFGHTFGHVFETETNYSDEILHGEAVAIGMLMAAKMSLNFKMISENKFDEIKSHLINCGFVIDPKKIRRNWNLENLIEHLYKDKKNEDGNLTFILLEKIGSAKIVKSVALADFKKVIEEFCDAEEIKS
ncbi:MAG: 3-dehydroquinate synthase [Rickettsiales bacterium]|nr:3-dehydroquinate synthase [Rickettsiales bacterium]